MKFYFLIEIRDKKLKNKNCLWKDSVDNRQRYLYIVVNSQAIFLFSGHAYELEDFEFQTSSEYTLKALHMKILPLVTL